MQAVRQLFFRKAASNVLAVLRCVENVAVDLKLLLNLSVSLEDGNPFTFDNGAEGDAGIELFYGVPEIVVWLQVGIKPAPRPQCASRGRQRRANVVEMMQE